jgi:hypothetical protein
MELRPCSIKFICLHHTAGNEKTLEAIRNYHMISEGYGDIGYNAVVFPDGSIPKIVNSDGVVTTGRSLKWSGAHSPGKAPDNSGYTMNQRSYGLCHVGNFETNTMPDAQFNASVAKCAALCRELGITPSIYTIRRHKDDFATLCPGKNFHYEKYVDKVQQLYVAMSAKMIETVKTIEKVQLGGDMDIEIIKEDGVITRKILHADAYHYLDFNLKDDAIYAYTKKGRIKLA